MAPNSIGLQLRCGNTFIAVRPVDSGGHTILVTDVAGREVSPEEHRLAVEYLLSTVSKIRKQAFEMLGGTVG